MNRINFLNDIWCIIEKCSNVFICFLSIGISPQLVVVYWSIVARITVIVGPLRNRRCEDTIKICITDSGIRLLVQSPQRHELRGLSFIKHKRILMVFYTRQTRTCFWLQRLDSLFLSLSLYVSEKQHVGPRATGFEAKSNYFYSGKMSATKSLILINGRSGTTVLACTL